MSDSKEGVIFRLSELTDLAIEKETESLAGLGNRPSQTMIDAIRENLGVWEDKLFPLLKAQGKSVHKVIAEILAKAGYAYVTAAHVCVVISKVRKERSSRV